MNVQDFSLRGWVPLSRKTMGIEGSNLDDLYKEVTESDHIIIYLDRDRCDGDERRFNRLYRSEGGFTVEDVLTLIHKTYWIAVKRLYECDPNAIDNLAIRGFSFDPRTNRVYPHTDS